MSLRGKCLAAAMFVAAGFSMSPALSNKANDTLNIAWDAQLENADKYYNTSREGVLLASMVWDLLIERDPVTMEYKPSLATAWRWDGDMALEFDLRKGVKFHDGQPFDADDVVYTLNFAANPENKSLSPTNTSWIKNVEKIDQFKVRINFRKTFPAALEFLAGPLPIYPHLYYSKVGPKGMAQQPIGSGPYKVQGLEAGKSITLVKNTDYWGDSPKGRPQIGKIVVTFPPEKTTQIAGLLSGSLDWIWYVPTDQVRNLERSKGVTIASGETMRIGYLSLDAAGRSGKSPLQDVRVRQAIAHAINRAEFTKAFFPPSANVLKAPCFPTQFGCYQGAKVYEYDLAKAKALMKEAGVAEGFNTTLYAYRQPPSWAEAIAGSLSQIGIKASVQILQYPAFRTKNHEGVTPISFGDWGSNSINDGSAVFGNFFGATPDNFTGDKELQTWVDEAGSRSDPKKREEFYKLAIDRIIEQMYMLPMNSFGVYYAYSSELNFVPYKDEIPRYYLYSWK
jgi:peptide/nickel transport system substrate-binding protein